MSVVFGSESYLRSKWLVQPTCGPLTNRTEMGCLIVRATYVSFVLSALQVRLSYISRTRQVRVLESYIGTQEGSKAHVRVP